jgi:hypothetical protein
LNDMKIFVERDQNDTEAPHWKQVAQTNEAVRAEVKTKKAAEQAASKEIIRRGLKPMTPEAELKAKNHDSDHDRSILQKAESILNDEAALNWDEVWKKKTVNLVELVQNKGWEWPSREC